MNTPRVVFCTTCKGRALHLKQTLPQNLTDNPQATFLILDYDSDDDLQKYLWASHRADIEAGRVILYSYTNGGKWHIAHAKNMAARCALLEGAEILCTLDADNFTGPCFEKFIIERFTGKRAKPESFLYPDFAAINRMPWTPERPRRGFAGRLALWADVFVKMGGYDEQYAIWGSEDIDMLGRLKRVGYTGEFFNTQNLHVVTHGPDVRFKEYPEAAKNEGKWQAKQIDARTERVVNGGKFGCGTVHRHNGYGYTTTIELEPLPTRIFGIGMQRTATTSLHAALQVLGFDSLHWGQGEAALIWHELRALGRSPTLEQHYAICDNPIPLFYKELDLAYPGSKFILTVRDEVDWLASVRWLWDAKRNPTRYLWDVYPISHQIHTALYGCQDFDASVFLQRYRQHNAEVIEYFKCRPQDLLIMRMDQGAGWRELCAFLECPIPPCRYPSRNRTTCDVAPEGY